MTRRAGLVARDLVPLALVLTLSATGCTDAGSAAQSTGDCSSQVRAEGIVYTSYGVTERAGTKHSSAERAECHDGAKDGPGSVFPDPPRRVTTWTFDGYPATEVLGVRFDRKSFGVYVADTVPPDEQNRIYRALRCD